MAHEALFSPVRIGAVDVTNRIFLAPLTRNRATPDGVPGPFLAEYYAQRASGGLLITEATQISPMGKGYINTPGIHSDAQIARWKEITDGVHALGGKIALQLWHVGRISHSSLLPGHAQPVSASGVRANAQTFIETGLVDTSQPRALSIEEIQATIADYAQAARNAITAGFDLVEVHAANGYLIDQFLRDGSNRRDDEYGGSAENRARFLREVVAAVVDAIGADRVGVRLSPTGQFNDMADSDPATTFTTAVERSMPSTSPIFTWSRNSRALKASRTQARFWPRFARPGTDFMSPMAAIAQSALQRLSSMDTLTPWRSAVTTSPILTCPSASARTPL